MLQNREAGLTNCIKTITGAKGTLNAAIIGEDIESVAELLDLLAPLIAACVPPCGAGE